MDSQSSATSEASQQSPKIRKDPIWEKFNETEKSGKRRAVCKECAKDFLPKCSAIKKHWEDQHMENSCVEGEPATKKLRKSLGDNRKSDLDAAFSKVLAIPALSVNTFLHPHMRNFLSLLNRNYEIPKSHQTLKDKLLRCYQETKESILRVTSSIRMRPSITCDVWVDASNKNSYLGVTLHFCNAGVLKRIFLGLRPLLESHTGAYLQRETESILDEYDLSLLGVFKIVTDNGSNMLSAYTTVEQLSNEKHIECFEDEDLDFSWIQGFSNLPDESKLVEAFPQRVSCFAHGLQLVISRVFKDKVIGTSAFKKMIQSVNRFKHSHAMTKELAEECGKVVIAPSTTRWGSIIAVIKRFLLLKESIYEVASKKCNLPSTDEILWLEEIQKICSPLITMLSRIQAERTVTISHALEYLKTLFFVLENEQSGFGGGEFSKYLQKALKDRFSTMLQKDLVTFNPIFTIASSLDPQTASCLNDEELKSAAEWIFQILPSDQFIRTESVPAQKSDANSTLDGLISRMKETNKTARRNETTTSRSKSWIMNALYRVQNSGPVDPLVYWTSMFETEYHALAMFAVEVLSVPATSAPIERIFSSAGLATTNRRNRTEFDLLNAQLVIYCNSEMLC